MHTRDAPPSYARGYEWWLAKEARARSLAIAYYGLPWGFPAWIGRGALNANQVEYVTAWAAGARDVHNLTIGWLGVWNEDSWTTDYVKKLRASLDAAGLNRTQLVLSDNALFSLPILTAQMDGDADFASSVGALGVHYPDGSTSTAAAVASGKRLWSSEDSSSNDDDEGGGCWARILNWNYLKGNYTATIMWNLVSAYYADLRWYGDSLINAPQPWSGHYEVKSPVWMTAHTTQFAQPGWRYLPQGEGSGWLAGGGSYVTLVSPGDGGDWSTIIETMTPEHSQCIRNNPKAPWNVNATQTVTLAISGGLRTDTPIHVWKSVLFVSGQGYDDDDTGPGRSGPASPFLFEQQPDLQIVDGAVTLTVEVDAVVSLTTTTGQRKGAADQGPSKSASFPLPYADSFDGYANDTAPRYLSDQAGSFSVMNRDGKGVLRQSVPESPTWAGTAWHGQDSVAPLSIIGDYNASDYAVTVTAAADSVPSSGPAPLLSLVPCDAVDESQRWVWNATGVFPGSISSVDGEQCMDVYGCKEAAGTPIWTWPCIATQSCGNQLWTLDEQQRLVTHMTSHLCLSAPSLTMQQCVASAGQVWSLDDHPASNLVTDPPSFSLRSAASDGHCLSRTPPPGTLGDALVTVGARLGGPLSASGCGGAPRERRCVAAYSSSWYDYGYFFTVRANGSWALRAGGTELAAGHGLPSGLGDFHTLSLSTLGSSIVASYDGARLASVTDATYPNGWAGIGSGFHYASFDNFSLSRAPAATAEATTRVSERDFVATMESPVLVGSSNSTKYWFSRIHGTNTYAATGGPKQLLVSLSMGGDGTPCPPPGGPPQNCSASLQTSDDGATWDYVGTTGPNAVVPLGPHGSGIFRALNYGGHVNGSSGNLTATIPSAVWNATGATPHIEGWEDAQFVGFPEPLVSVVQRGSVVPLKNGSLLTTLYGSFLSDARNNHTRFARTTMIVRADPAGDRTGLLWHYVAAIGHAYNPGTIPSNCLGSGESDMVRLNDSSLLLVSCRALCLCVVCVVLHYRSCVLTSELFARCAGHARRNLAGRGVCVRAVLHVAQRRRGRHVVAAEPDVLRRK